MSKSRSMTKRQDAGGSHYSDDLRDGARKLRDDVRDIAMTAGQAARSQVDPLEEYVQENPLRALLMAGGIGILLGIFFFKR